jgi:uncharacterized protein
MAEEDGSLDAGEFSSWLGALRGAWRGEHDADVPCGSCTACCTSSQFVHIGPEEVETLAHVPRDLLFAAPGLPTGHFVLGYDERGHCPMFTGSGCSIYSHRPKTCRDYDCRVFAAAGLDPGKPLIARQVRRWRFSAPTAGSRQALDELRVCAGRLRRQHPSAMPAEIAVRTVEGSSDESDSPEASTH